MYSLPLIETSEDCAKVSTSDERQSFVENLDQAQNKNMQADKDIEKIAMVLRCPSLFVKRVRSNRVSEILLWTMTIKFVPWTKVEVREMEGTTQGIEE
ncbi:uncharacterized protein G2W53_026218 [Senna tora]|uniref:Uncharacterized protein n=1 Tax=Senna tora TaxID=362788 RepID=A0A834TET0_9FABA|nr:uncharacterized protein G2W53_026218 [Senna tora]